MGDLAAGAHKSFSIVVRTDPSRLVVGPLINKATVSVEGDINPDNDTSSVTTQVSSGAVIPSLQTWSLLLLLAAVAVLGMSARRKST